MSAKGQSAFLACFHPQAFSTNAVQSQNQFLNVFSNKCFVFQ